MGNRNSRFQRGSGVYVCRFCKRNTRETGTQSVGSDLCPECYELSGLENSVSDGTPLAEVIEERDRLLDAAIKKGSNAERIRGILSILFPKQIDQIRIDSA